MKISPMNAEDDVTAAPDGSLVVMIEMPIDRLKSVRALVLGGQGIVQGKVHGQALEFGVLLEIAEDEVDQGVAEVVRFPGADAEEIGEVAGIDAVEFQGSQLAKSLAPGCGDQKVGEALEVTELWGVQGNANQAQEGDDGGGTAYDGLHGSRVSKTVGLITTLFYSRDLFSAAPVFARSHFSCRGGAKLASLQYIVFLIPEDVYCSTHLLA